MRPIFILFITLSLLPATFAPSLAQDAPAWGGFRGDDARRGRSAAPGPDRADVGWTFRLDGGGYSSAAIASDGTAFVGASDSVHAVSREGERIWAAASGGLVISSPALTSGAVYVGSRDGYLYAFRRSDGFRLWRFLTGDEVWSSPAVGADGTVFVGSLDGCLYAISPQGNERWRRCTDGAIASSPTVAPIGAIYFGSRDGYLYAVRANGSDLWRVQLDPGHDIVSTAALGDDGAIYVATRGGNLFALSGTGQPLWQQPYRVGAEVVSSPAVAYDGTILIAATDGSLHALRPDGRPRWQSPFRIDFGFYSSPAVDTRGVAYIGSSDGQLHAMNPDGSRRWVLEFDAPVWASPSIGADGTLIIATTETESENAGLHAIASLEFDIVTPEEVAAGANVPIRIRGRDGSAPRSARLFYRRGGERVFTNSVEMTTEGDGVLEGVIPPEAVSIRGVEYYVDVEGSTFRRTYPAFRPSTAPAVQRVTVGSMTADVLLPRRAYRMISAPLELSETSVERVLVDDYGPYTRSQWRLFRWEDDRYAEHPDIRGTFTPGTSLFLATMSGTPFTTPPGRSTDTSEPYRITLQPGWNQIANPFAFPVSWNEVHKDEAAIGAIGYWDGSEMRQDGPSIRTLRPWEGYFVFNRTSAPVVIGIPPREEEVDPPGQSVRPAGESVWRIEAGGSHGMQDTQNWIGFTPSARNHRTWEAPSFDEHVRLSVVDGGERYARFLRPEAQNGASWTVEITTSNAGASGGPLPISVAILPETAVPAGYSVRVVDIERQAVVPLIDGSFVIELTQRRPVGHLEILIGTSEFVEERVEGMDELPVAPALLQNYPNPFNAETAIVFETREIETVGLVVFDLTGRRIRTLASGQLGPGRHEIVWDGSDDAGREVASGMYVYRLETDSGTTSRIMTVIR